MNPNDKNRRISFLPHLFGILTALAIIGLIFPEKEIVGAIVGAVAAILIWVLTYANTQIEEEERRKRLRAAIWTEMIQLFQALTKESLWWFERVEEIHKERREQGIPSKTMLRVMEQYDVPILRSNLDKMADFDTSSADAIGVVLAELRMLVPASVTLYDIEDRLADDEVPAEKFWKHQLENADGHAKRIARSAYHALQAAHYIDVGGLLKKHHSEVASKDLIKEGLELRIKLAEIMEKYKLAT